VEESLVTLDRVLTHERHLPEIFVTAAFMALHDHLQAHPPKIWQAVLAQAEAAAPRRTTANYGPIVFSLQDRSSSWV
jgi:hypothetical protein